MALVDLERAVQRSKEILSVYWPIHAFAAVNPLWSCITRHFLDVSHEFNGLGMPLSYYQALYQKGLITDAHLRSAIQEVLQVKDDQELQIWQTQAFAIQKLPDKDAFRILYSEQAPTSVTQQPLTWVAHRCYECLLAFWGPLARSNQHERHDEHLLDYWRDRFPQSLLTQLDIHHEHNDLKCLQQLLEAMEIPQSLWTDYLKRVLRYLYGWASFINWLEHRPDNPWLPPKGSLVMVFVLWLGFEYQMKVSSHRSYRPPDQSHYCLASENFDAIKSQLIWQVAYEKSYYEPLERQLKRTAGQISHNTPTCQAIFCIDPRSERIRRHLEKFKGYDTYGCAGFFGIPFQLEHQTEGTTLQCPALIKPDALIHADAEQRRLLSELVDDLPKAIQANQSSFLGTYVLFEMFGLWQCFQLMLKTWFPRVFVRSARSRVDKDHLRLRAFMDQYWEKVCDQAHAFLLSIGLIDHFAPKIVLCAHESESVNNPFAGTLDCGACGGNSGVPNAIMMCWVLNNCEIRHTLQAKGIHIPNETTFVPASHNTTTDEMTILESPEAHQNLWHDLNKAGQAARVERIDQYPQPQPFRAAKDWSELIPEWGLVNNAVMIIGRRSLTKNLDLQGRAFLHSYEPDNDQTGEILASIMKGPMIVAHWINTQYYCSTVDPELFGAGDKAVHNLILGIGVMQGNLSDLKIGLPKQSVQYQGQLIHQPLRLTVFIQAPHKLVNEIIQNDWNLYQLVNNQWLRIRVIDN